MIHRMDRGGRSLGRGWFGLPPGWAALFLRLGKASRLDRIPLVKPVVLRASRAKRSVIAEKWCGAIAAHLKTRPPTCRRIVADLIAFGKGQRVDVLYPDSRRKSD